MASAALHAIDWLASYYNNNNKYYYYYYYAKKKLFQYDHLKSY